MRAPLHVLDDGVGNTLVPSHLQVGTLPAANAPRCGSAPLLCGD
jgi:hypothetical protein